MPLPADAREQLIDHLPSMRRFARSLTGNSSVADDVVQDALLRAWTNFDKYTAGTNLKAWLFTIIRNVFLTHCRKTHNEVEDIDGGLACHLAVQPTHDTALLLADVNAAFRGLSDNQREAVFLIGVLGFSYQEAAEASGVSLGTLKSRLNRGRRALSASLESAEGDLSDVNCGATRAVNASERTRKR